MTKLLAMLKRLGATPTEIEEATAEIDESNTAATERLNAKNKELLAELRKAKGSNGEDSARLQDENDRLKEELSVATKNVKKLEGDKAKVEKDLGDALNLERSANHRLLVEDGLTKGLTELGITQPARIAAVRALLKEKGVLKVAGEGDVRKAIAVLKKDGRDTEVEIGAYLKDWANTDEGKEFVPANGNSGAGVNKQPGGPAGQKTMKRDAFESLAPQAKMDFIRGTGVVTD